MDASMRPRRIHRGSLQRRGIRAVAHRCFNEAAANSPRIAKNSRGSDESAERLQGGRGEFTADRYAAENAPRCGIRGFNEAAANSPRIAGASWISGPRELPLQGGRGEFTADRELRICRFAAKFYASMRPRRIHRGSRRIVAIRYCSVRELQGGRGEFTADRCFAGGETGCGLTRLQGGRGEFTADRDNIAKQYNLNFQLQGGRGEFTADRSKTSHILGEA